ncbi:VPLPA-CTERM sorting domain-containing protein [uncultured Roseibium sp.]|uniref:VPLPA-CTERM sorting domain-containing protein n=1 Tax=uncultured Roseibium sp. TaxID=1936171 RepID=UPI0026362AC2|nr:VPLPA-CTERM sorting domain-containing protein [uncultured Roseibium sp.]
MKRLVISVFMTISLAFGVQGASAAGLGLTTEPPTLNASFALIEYFDNAPFGDLATFGADIDSSDGVSPTGAAFVDFIIGFDPTDPANTLTGGFDVFDDNGLFLSGVATDAGYETDTIEFLLDVIGGSASGAFGSQVLMTIAFDTFEMLGDNPFDNLEDTELVRFDGPYIGSVSIAKVAPSAVIPIPAGLPLLLTALVGLGWLRRRTLA